MNLRFLKICICKSICTETYSQFSLFMAVLFYKVAVNTELTDFLGENLVKFLRDFSMLPSTNQYINLFSVYFYLKISYLKCHVN